MSETSQQHSEAFLMSWAILRLLCSAYSIYILCRYCWQELNKDKDSQKIMFLQLLFSNIIANAIYICTSISYLISGEAMEICPYSAILDIGNNSYMVGITFILALSMWSWFQKKLENLFVCGNENLNVEDKVSRIQTGTWFLGFLIFTFFILLSTLLQQFHLTKLEALDFKCYVTKGPFLLVSQLIGIIFIFSAYLIPKIIFRVSNDFTMTILKANLIFMCAMLPFFFRDLERMYVEQEVVDISLATLGYIMLSIRGAIFVQWIKKNLKKLAEKEFNFETQLMDN